MDNFWLLVAIYILFGTLSGKAVTAILNALEDKNYEKSHLSWRRCIMLSWFMPPFLIGLLLSFPIYGVGWSIYHLWIWAK